jgi:magnesium chelatase family protein
MVTRITTVAFEGIEAVPIDVQCQLGNGLPGFSLVGLADKAVAESRERVRAALSALGLALPPKRIVINLAPADRVKAGTHYDLPIALALLTAIEVLPAEFSLRFAAIGELALDGVLAPVQGALAAAMTAFSLGKGLICPAAQGPEAAWSGGEILAPVSLLALINHGKGRQMLAAPAPLLAADPTPGADMAEVKGQESAKRAVEIAAAGNHNILMIGPPGSGKSMLAARLPGLLPPLDPDEALEASLIHSMGEGLPQGRLLRRRPFRAPHHSVSVPALVGGGPKARPGEISLAHRGVLFLDELPEFPRACLEALRQPLENGSISIARAQAHIAFPARFLLVAAMNPCACGHLGDAQRQCRRAPACGVDYAEKLSGPLLDRIDLTVHVPAVSAADLTLPPASESSAVIAARVAAARDRQRRRFQRLGDVGQVRCNAEADGRLLTVSAPTDPAAALLLRQACERLGLSARSYHRVLRVARSLADLEGADMILRQHIAEALSYRPGPVEPISAGLS